MMMNRLSILLFIAFIFLAESQASNLLSPPDSSIVPSIYNRNSIQLELGGLLVIGGATLSYERMFSKTRYTSKRGLALTGFQKVSAGGWYSWGSEGGSLKYQTGLLLGKNGKHLEIAGGGWLMHTNNPCCGEKLLSPWPTATFAYRNQKPKSKAIFRIGSTFPELIFVSWGKSF